MILTFELALFVGLRKLVLSNCPNLDDQGLIPLLEGCSNQLRVLHLQGSIGLINDCVARALVEHCR